MREPEDHADPNASTIPAPPPDVEDPYDLGFRTRIVLNAEEWAKFAGLMGWDGFASAELDDDE